MTLHSRSDTVTARSLNGAARPDAAALAQLEHVPALRLYTGVTPVEELARLRAAIGGGPRLLIKRDDVIPFGFGGNKVRKAERVMVEAVRGGADTVVTVGSIQSNHARVTAAAAAKLGLRCVLIVNGEPPQSPSANALLAGLLGAEIEYIPTRAERAAALCETVARLKRNGRRPFAIPLGASTPLGALGFASAVSELLTQTRPPAAIVHATSSGGTQAGLVLGCAVHGLATRVIGISTDDDAGQIAATVHDITRGAAELLGSNWSTLAARASIEVDGAFVGDGYGAPSAASHEAQRLAAQQEALFVDHTYTAKALAGLIARVRAGEFRDDETVLFWHTGGQVGLFAH